jgi:hypothetical protein
MRYAILIAGDEKASLDMSAEESQSIVAAYKKYTDDLARAGVLLAGEGFHRTDRGARVTVVAGKRKVTDGPFSEAKEVIGGYFLIQVKSKEEALEWAARCPAAHYSERSFVEVREIMEFD